MTDAPNRPPLSPLAQAVVDAHYGAPAMTAPNRPPLSPATRAIVEAFDARYELCGPFDDSWQELCLAAAFRALADHQTPAWDGGPLCHWSPSIWTRRELRNIAAELEGSTSTGSTL